MKQYDSLLRDQFYNDAVFAVDLIEIHLDTPLYFCSGGYDIAADTPTAPGAGLNTYLAQGDFISFSSIPEEMDVKVGKITVSLSGVGTLAQTFINPNVSGRRVVIYKCYLDLTTGQIVNVANNPLLTFDGQIQNVSIVEGQKTATLNIDVASIFADFERAAGRKTNNESNWYFQGQKYDTSFEKAGMLKTIEIKWGRT